MQRRKEIWALFFLGISLKNQYLKNLKLFLKKYYLYFISLKLFVIIINKNLFKNLKLLRPIKILGTKL
jgi:hypothetical protein